MDSTIPEKDGDFRNVAVDLLGYVDVKMIIFLFISYIMINSTQMNNVLIKRGYSDGISISNKGILIQATLLIIMYMVYDVMKKIGCA